MEHKNLLLIDCDPSEISDFVVGLEKTSGICFKVLTKRTNTLHGSKIKTVKRYLKYFKYPFDVMLRYRNARLVVGWQQFFAINYAFICRLFHIKRDVKIICVNFTYKRKHGILGAIYHKYMQYAVNDNRIIGLHVPSNTYAAQVSEELGVDSHKMIVSCFGTPDRRQQWQDLKCTYNRYALAIGRSNRDFDFLARIWKRAEISNTGCKLIIISDTWVPSEPLTSDSNILHLNNVKGDDSFPYFTRCDFQIIPIADGNICSGDTVLLNSMMMSKPVVVTAPSTLSEMYVNNGCDGLHISRDEYEAGQVILRLILDSELRHRLGTSARQSYEQKFSRTQLGSNIGLAIKRLIE